MKKIISILLILATLCLFLFSCNGNSDTDTSKDTTQISDTSSDVITDSDVNSDTSSDITSDTETNTDTETDTDTNVETDTDTDDTEKVYAPNINLLDSYGKVVTLESFRGKVVVLNFWASWCPPCKAEMPDFQAAYEKYGNDVEFVMVSHLAWGSDTMSSAKSFYDQSGYTFPIYFDYQFEGYYAYDLQSIPRTVIINSDGTVHAYYTGMISEQILENVINSAK